MTTPAEYAQAIAAAQHDGNAAAVAELQQMQAAEQSAGPRREMSGSVMAPNPQPPATVTQKVGTGVKDVGYAAGRWLGRVSPEEYAQHQKDAAEIDPTGLYRMGGQMIATAPALMIPGVNSAVGGAVMGGALGMLMDPEDPLKGGALGAGFGLVPPAARAALPRVWEAAKNVVARNTPWLAGQKQKIAERAFFESIPEAERAGVQQAGQNYQPVIPGFEQTTGSASRNPTILETERRLSSGGSPFGAPLRQRVGDQARAVNEAWEREFGTRPVPGGAKAQSTIAAEERQAYADANLPVRFPRAPTGADFSNTSRAFNAEFQNAVGPRAAALQSVRDQLTDALANAQRNGLTTSLHEWRRTAVNDALTKMFGENSSQTQKLSRESLDRIKAAFDRDMDKLLGDNRWSDFMQGYRNESMKVSQAKAGEEMLNQLRARPEMAAETASGAGVHDPSGLGTKMREQFSGGPPQTRYGTPEYSQSGERLLQNTINEQNAANLRYAKDVAPVNSATAANLRAPLRILKQADDAATAATNRTLTTGHALSGGVGGTIGAMLGGPTGAVVGGAAGTAVREAVAPARAQALANIAQRVVQLYTDPRAAAIAIERMSLPPAERTLLSKMIEGGLSSRFAVGAAGYGAQ